MGLQLLINEDEKIAVRSLFDDRLSRFPDSLAIGDTLPLLIGLVERIQTPWNSRKFTPQALTSTTFRAALGVGAVPPGAGIMTYQYGNSLVNVTGDLSFDVSEGELEAALNVLPAIVTAGGVEVEMPSSSQVLVSFNEVGAQSLFSVNVANLFPTCVASTARITTGDAVTKEVQLINIVQNVGAINTISTAAASAAATITSVTTGSGSANAQWRLALTGNIYKGSLTISKTTGTTGTSGAILFDDTEAQIKAKLEATTGIGTGNVSVLQEDERTYLIEFIGSLALTAITLTVNGTNLTAIPELTGSLDLTGTGTQLLLAGRTERIVTLEIEKLVSGSPTEKIMRRDVLLVNPVATGDMSDAAFAGSSQSGLASMSSGVDSIAVTFGTAFAVAPSQVLCTVEKPSGGDNIWATVIRSTVSTTGFTAELSGTTTDANYKLSWVAIL